ncbi:MAG TPA: hypothetical protein VKH81_20910 [Candidatus Angelobacter sp.]|nr:hypothetical protein [Candidatus Angelobacter sp.]
MIRFLSPWLVLLAMPVLKAQNTPPDANHPAVPTITYDRLWPAYTPQNVNITVKSSGTAKYLSRNPVKSPDVKDTDPDYTVEFTISDGTLAKLFRDAKETNYFQGDFAFKKHPVASTGKKTLTFADQDRHFETTFDYSENKAIQEIDSIFQGISSTIEDGRKLQFLHRFDRLGLEDQLKGMESDSNLQELQIIAPTLKSIADDTSVLNIARARAKRLLEKSSK